VEKDRGRDYEEGDMSGDMIIMFQIITVILLGMLLYLIIRFERDLEKKS